VRWRIWHREPPPLPPLREWLDYPRPLRRWMWAKAKWPIFSVLWCVAWAAYSWAVDDGWARWVVPAVMLALGGFNGWSLVTWVKLYHSREGTRAWWANYEAQLQKTLAQGGVPLAARDQIVAHLLDDDIPGAARETLRHLEGG
jgi:hypothetical protein